MAELKQYFTLISLISFLLTISCKKKESNELARTYQECINYILKQDDSLGSIRNHACEKIPLSQTIKEYTSNLDNLNFSGCSDNFSDAFNKHIIAWDEMIEVTDKYANLRGEMHDLFDSIEKSKDSSEFKTRLKKIWDTWEVIESASKN